VRIYIATSWKARDVAARVAAELEARGHTIARRWWEDSPEAYECSEEYRERCAVSDREGAVAANVFILLAHPEAYGAMVEFGLALAPGWKRVIVVHAVAAPPGPTKDCVFFHLPVVKEVVGEAALYRVVESWR
jgi:hypothetical protein